MKNVALFGGSFDPVHKGHTVIIEALKKLEEIDKVVLMPTYLNPFKSHFTADAPTRLSWLEELYDRDKKVIVSDFEVMQNRPVATIETVCALQNEYGKIFVVIGADNLASLPQWHQFEKLQKMVTFIVVTRDNIDIDPKYKQLCVDVAVSSTQLRQTMDEQFLPPKIAKKIADYYKEHNAKKN